MQLKKNEIKIIQLLLASDNYISSYEIANSTGISRRRVRDEMKIVKDILATLHLNLLSKPSQGYYIEGKSSQDLTELQSIINKNERDDDSLIPSLPDERSNYILGRLINSREFIKLETLADELLVSRATIANDLVSIKNEFKKYVIDYFIDDYLHGRTPNPCIACNRYVKWEALLQRSLSIGADYIATGHYARIDKLPNGRYAIRRSATLAKDQTYALYNLTQEQLEHTLMPVGNYSKDQIREMAEKIGLQVANKQDICFVPDGDYASFIEENADAPIRQGNFVTPDGKILGKHKGIIHYTVGQRKGLGLALGYPAFVLEIRPETDEVVIGTYEESLTHTLRANELNFMSVEDITEPIRVFAKIRYNHKGAWCTVEKTGEDEITCTFDEPIRAVTPGQAVVLYDGEYVLGGGTIL